MYHRGLLLACLSILVLHAGTGWAQDARTLQIRAVRQQEIRRLMNIVKKAPQPEVAERALQDLYKLGIPHQDIRRALVLDYLLLDIDKFVRLRTCWRLIHSQRGPSIVAAQNLRNLIAAETDPDLVWMYATALSSIDPQTGTALDVLKTIPHDPVLSKAMPQHRSANDKDGFFRIAERLRAEGETTREAFGAIQEEWQFGGTAPPGNEVDLLKSFGVDPKTIARSDTDDLLRESAANTADLIFGGAQSPKPGPPPQKIPAHPLIAGQRFGEILDLMRHGSREAWELFRTYGADFPQPQTAKFCIERVLGSDWRDRERVMTAFWHLGGDAELTAVVAYAVVHDLGIAHHVEMLERIQQPGPYSQELLRQLRHHKNSRVRRAVLETMTRSPDLQSGLLAELKSMLEGDDPEIKITAIDVIIASKKLLPHTRSMLEESLLKEENPKVLGRTIAALESRLSSREFRRKVFDRIDSLRLSPMDLVLMEYLVDQVARESKAGRELQKKADRSRFRFEALQLWLQAAADLEELIEDAQTNKERMDAEAFKQLKKLGLD